MKVLLLRDVYKLGLAGDVKKVADGYARNFLLPRGFATAATAGALKQAERVRASGDKLRQHENREKAGVAEALTGLRLEFPVRASEQGRLYGSVTHQMVADAIEAATGEAVDRRSVMAPPLRETGVFEVPVRLTADLVPTVTAVLYPEDEEPPGPDDVATDEQQLETETDAVAAQPEPESSGEAGQIEPEVEVDDPPPAAE
ncbi:MAG: 50S ribosomal protein L9 [Anaerolineales bacterium]|jgi:large subunit ribosomal protein L9|nr:50S ribosomal protein L9 [Anaerolineales bacterium]HJO33922.1 50S ribosomal protein L9 [Anaerolineales bacterium]